MTDDGSNSDSSPAQPVRLPETARAALKKFTEDPRPERLEQLITSVIEYSESHSGPLPTPGDLARYEQVLPGSAERIMRLAERPHEEVTKEQAHRQGLETVTVRRSLNYRACGLWMGYSIGAGAIGGAIYCATSQSWIGVAAFLCLPMVGIVSVLVTGQPWKQAEQQTKPEDEPKKD